ncbi:universal stress protein [Nostocoides sp.]|uniref:universal stress protein n=1 Tax=Nostocoides sp. TaxID=1917966 RepID=UPI002C1A27B6|nr:universal stress protein [Tetrasphaera sp.]
MTIVVGYIPSPEGLAALDAAIEEARVRHTRLVVVNTGNHGDYSVPAFATAHDLDALDGQLRDAGIDHDVRQATQGRSASEELLSTAEAEGAQLLVIGLRRRSPLGKFIMGSTAQEVLLDAPCPVLSVKA